MVLVESVKHFTLLRAVEKHGFEVAIQPQESVSATTRDLKMEAPLRTTVFLCKVACPGLPSGNREQLAQNCDQTHSLLGRGGELLRACCLSSLLSNCEQCSHELGLQVTWETGQQPALQWSGHLLAWIQTLVSSSLAVSV